MLIERIAGKLIKCLPTHGIIDVQGVGYSVEMPLSVLVELPPEGSDVVLWIHTHVREDAIKLYGFLNYSDRIAFDILLQLNGVGPKVALATLSALSVSALCRAVEMNSIQAIQRVPGVGPRKAEKMLVELKSKLTKLRVALAGAPSLPASGAGDTSISGDFEGVLDDIAAPVDDVRSALENLGFKDKHVEAVLKKVLQQHPSAPFQELLRVTLVALAKPVAEDEGASMGGKPIVSEPELGRDSPLY